MKQILWFTTKKKGVHSCRNHECKFKLNGWASLCLCANSIPRSILVLCNDSVHECNLLAQAYFLHLMGKHPLVKSSLFASHNIYGLIGEFVCTLDCCLSGFPHYAMVQLEENFSHWYASYGLVAEWNSAVLCPLEDHLGNRVVQMR